MSRVEPQKIPVFPHIIGAGCAGSIAEVFTLPTDTAKVRLMTMRQTGQINPAYKGLFSTMAAIIKEEGPKPIQRQTINAGIRVALYDYLLQCVCSDQEYRRPPIYKKIVCSLTSGAVGISLANPMDVVKVRIQADRNFSKPRYTGTANAYVTILREEKFLAF